jgi:hypothetical protein
MDRVGCTMALALVLEVGVHGTSAACAWKNLQAISPE